MSNGNTSDTRLDGVVAAGSYNYKAYHNCRPVLDPESGQPLLYVKGTGFTITNNTRKPIEFALESLNVEGFGLGVPDLSTSRYVRAYETVTLWKNDPDAPAGNGECEVGDCEEDDTICDDSTGREILFLNYDETSDPQYYLFKGRYTPAVCCEEEEECEDKECCEKGEICEETCETPIDGEKCEAGEEAGEENNGG